MTTTTQGHAASFTLTLRRRRPHELRPRDRVRLHSPGNLCHGTRGIVWELYADGTVGCVWAWQGSRIFASMPRQRLVRIRAQQSAISGQQSARKAVPHA